MNRIYNLVWNRTLKVVQVASELAHSHGSDGVAESSSMPARRPLAVACALALAALLVGVATPLPAVATTTTGVAGQAGGHASSGNGGASGQGSVNVGGPGPCCNSGGYGRGGTQAGNGGQSPIPMGGGNGGGNASHSDQGGSYGSGGTPGGGNGSLYGGGGGSGGNLVNSGTGSGGGGGGGLNPGDGGGGGGGGSLAVNTTSGNTTTILSGDSIIGGAGGAAGGGTSGGSDGGGGGGGAGMWLQAGAIGIVQAGGAIGGGAGGNGGNFGGGGAGGAGVLLSGNATLSNGGNVSGGAGGTNTGNGDGSGNGAGGVGIMTDGGAATITNTGAISGRVGIVSGGSATINNSGTISGSGDAVQFTGSGSTLNLLTGSNLIGAVEVTDGHTATIAALNDGLTLGSNLVTNQTGAFNFSPNGHTLTASGVISGHGSVSESGSGTLVLGGVSQYFVGHVTVSGGTLQASNPFNLGGYNASLTLDGGTLQATGTGFTNVYGGLAMTANGGGFDIVDPSNIFTVSQSLSGGGALTKTGAGTLVLSGTNSYGNGTTISAGTLQGNTTSLQGAIADNAALVFNQATDGAYDGSISGTGTLTKSGTAALTMNGDSHTFTGTSAVAAGTLTVGDSTHTGAALSGAVTVNSGATLAGYGAIGGTVTVNGGSLAPGSMGVSGVTSFGTLKIGGGLTLAAGSQLNYGLGAPVTGDSINVTGGLNVTGKSTFNLTADGGFGPGQYTLITAGSITAGSLGNLALAQPTLNGDALTLSATSTAINLLSANPVTNIWNPGQPAGNTLETSGGSGTWSTTSATWSNSSFDAPTEMSPLPGFAIFSGPAVGFTSTPAAVNVDDSGAAVSAAGMQFAVTGYQLSGTSLGLVATPGDAHGQSEIRVGDGASDAGKVATIGNVLTGTAGLDKTYAGTLVLTGANTFTGGVTVSGGTLEANNNSALGSNTTTVDNSGGLASTLQVDKGVALSNHIVLNNRAALNNAGNLNDTVDNYAVESDAGIATVNNDATGSITGTAVGVGLSSGGSVYNVGRISASQIEFGVGVLIGSTDGSVTNSQGGSISVNSGIGVSLGDGGSVINTDAGSIISASGSDDGTNGVLISGAAGTVINRNGASISSGQIGVALLDGGETYNGVGSSISGTTLSVFAGKTFGSHDPLGNSGSVTLLNDGTLMGSVQLDSNFANTVDLSAGGSITGDLNIGTNTASTLTLDGTNATPQLYSGAVTGATTFAGALTKADSGTWIVDTDDLSNVSGTTISGGTLQLGDGSANNIAGSIGNGNVVNAGSLVFDHSNDVAYSGVISGTGTLTQQGAGTLTLTGANTFTGSIMVSAGTLEAASSSALGSGTATVDNSGGLASTLRVDSGVTLSNHIVLNNNAVLDNAGTLNDATDFDTVGTSAGTATVNNHNGGRISSAGITVLLGSGGSVTNAGAGSAITSTVAAAAAVAIQGGAGTVSNTDGATISGYQVGVGLANGGSVTNAGAGSVISGYGSSAAIDQSGSVGIEIGGASGTVNNTDGAMISGAAVGVALSSGGTISNGVGSTIEATGTTAGNCYTTGDCSIFVLSASDIPGAGYGGALTLSNAGSIIGNVQMDASAANLTTLTAGGSITGDLDIGSNAGSTLTLDGASTTSQLYSKAVTGTTTFNGALTKSGSGTWVIGNDGLASVTGTTISGGTLQLGDGSTNNIAGSIGNGNVANAGSLVFDHSNDVAYSGVISGTGTLAQQGAGTLTLTGANTFQGGTTVNAGSVLQVGDGGTATAGSIGTGNVVDNGTLAFNRNSNVAYGGAISGAGTLTQHGPGTLTLDGNSGAFSGSTSVTGTGTTGGLVVGSIINNGAALGGDLTMASGTTLSGFGSVGGGTGVASTTEIQSGATLNPGVGAGSIGTLTVNGNLTLASGSNLNFDFGAPGANLQTAGIGDHVSVNGDLNAAGATLNVNDVNNAMGPGLYNVISYPGGLTQGGIALAASTPVGITLVNNTAGKQFDLYDTAGLTLNIWAPTSATAPGGSGTWSNASKTWTNTNGDGPLPMQPQPGFAIFQGTPGTVTVDNGVNGASPVSTIGMQFAVDGYSLTGTPLTLIGTTSGSVTTAPIIRVGDGSSAGASMTATINNELDGTDGFTKTDAGTLVLDGNSQNSLTGGIAVQGGTLELGANSRISNPLGMSSGTALVVDANGYFRASEASAGMAGMDAVTGTSFSVTNNGGYIQGARAGAGNVASGNIGGAGGAGISGSGFTVTNNGSYAGVTGGVGGYGSVAGGMGGAGISGSDFTVTNGNGGYIRGYRGGTGSGAGGAGGAGGSGVTGSSFTLTNAAGGHVYGGAGGSATTATAGLGAAGVSGTDFTLTNAADGYIYGGKGGAAATGTSGLGGAGVSGTGFTLSNSGGIEGGDGGGTTTGTTGHGGAGVMGSGFTLTNSGRIDGGSGGRNAAGLSGLSVAGVVGLGGASVITSGYIGGGTFGSQADAIDFSDGGNRLTLETGFTFAGNVVSSSGLGSTATNGGDTLALGGDHSGPGATGDGTFDVSNVVDTLPSAATTTQYVGFAQFAKSGNSTWTLTGAGQSDQNWTIANGTLAGDATALVGNITFAPGTGDTPAVLFDQGSTNANSPTSATYAGTITGTGSLTKTDDGTLILTGANTYGGGTTISAGVLQIGAGDAVGSLSGDISNNGTLAFDRGDNVSFAGSVSGTGALMQSGNGTLTLTGANSYTGGTTISTGTLQGDTSSLQGNITDNAALTFNQNNAGTFAGEISGSGSLSQIGTGVLTLTGANSYRGGTTITAGTLQGDTSSLQGNITDNAALVFNQTNAGTFAGAISGSGTLSQMGSGVLTLTGANSYSGGTTISGGTLQGDTSSLQGNIADNAALVFNQGTAGTFAGVISGSGTLSQMGSGVLTLTGANSYSGGTTISGGTLQGDTTSLQGNITNNAALVFNQNTAGTYVGALSGTGTVTQQGTDTLTLDGNSSTFTGTTTVQSGTLEVGDANTPTAILGGDVDVAATGTLRGHGTIGGNVVNAGTLWPGGSIGTLTVQGNYTQAVGSTFNVDATPSGQASLLTVGGTASILGGSTVVLAQAGNWAPQTNYTILTAAGAVSGQFATATSSLTFLTPTLTYTTNAVSLSLQRNDVRFASAAQTGNQRATADAVDSLGFSSPVYTAMTKLDVPTARHAFDQLSGEIHASTDSALVDDSRYVRDAINQHLLGLNHSGAEGTTNTGVSAWTSAWGHGGHNNGDGNAIPLQANGSGLLVGADLPLGSNSRLGAVVGHGQDSIQSNSVGSSAHVRADHAGIYAASAFGAFTFRAGAVYSWQNVRSNRAVNFGNFSDRLTSEYHAQTAQAYVEGGYQFNVSPGQKLEPFLNIARVRVHNDAVQESGGAAALAVTSNSLSVNTATLGLRDTFALESDGGIHAHASVGWQQAWGDLTPLSSMRFASGGDSFAIAGVPVARHAVTTNLGVDFTLAKNITLDASYLGQFASGVKDQGARMSLTVAF